MANIDTFLGSSLQNLNTLSNTVEDEKSKQIVEYLYTLTEQLQYAFNHIDEENMTDGVVQNIVKEETQSQYAHFTETETSITAVIQGLNAAQQAVKVIFDATGLTIKNGGFQILNTSNSPTFSVTNAGDVSIIGMYTTTEESGGGNTWKAVLDGGSIKFRKNNTVVGGFGYNGSESSLIASAQAFAISDDFAVGTSYSAIMGEQSNGSGNFIARASEGGNIGAQMVGLLAGSTGGAVNVRNTSTDNLVGQIKNSSAGGGILFLMDSSGSDTIQANGATGNITCVSLTQTSSKRYKTDIEDMTVERAKKLLDLNFVKFRYKDRDTYNYGLIAEDTDIEEIVTLDEQGRPDAIDYTKLIPYMGKLIQEQEKRIRRLEDERDN